ncbi:MAG: type II toxin-antitoxin system HipA family toxin [Burkholderiales bacterium]|nr:type II toxin-antitoxin system HipA family toxin [Burkholderiales bacterium]
MGRRSHGRTLEVWSNGQHVATWAMPARGLMELQYDEAWKQSPLGRPLSLSLPFSVGGLALKGDAVDHFFRNLLPDSEAIRQRMAAKFKAASTDAFDLLMAVGRDCVGAVQLLPPDAAPQGYDRIDGTALNEAGVARHLRHAVSAPAMGQPAEDDEFRISLAGAQEKSALLWHTGQWQLPHGTTPTTHIFKLPLGLVGNSRVNLSTSVENEWLCLRILKAYGLPVASAEMAQFEDQRVLVVERFDRQLHKSGNWWLRLPQEDFCQALGCSPNQKYEADGGPGFGDLAHILQQSTQPEQDRDTLLITQILFWMLAATDGHAKNFSLRLLAKGRFHLTPVYDVLSAWPVIGRGNGKWEAQKVKLAMAVEGKNRHYQLKSIQRRHFNRMAYRHGYARGAEPAIRQLLERTPSVIDSVRLELPADFPSQVADAILNGLESSAQALAQMPAE